MQNGNDKRLEFNDFAANLATIDGTGENVRLVVRVNRHALVVGARGAEWLPSVRVGATLAECIALEMRAAATFQPRGI